mgnify:CR=1 FL=1
MPIKRKSTKPTRQRAARKQRAAEAEAVSKNLTRAERRPKAATTPADDRALTRDNVLAFLAEHGSEAGNRDLVKHFRLKGAERIKLKRILKDIEGEGLIEKRRGRFHQPGRMPSVMLCDVTGRDADGELIAEPAEWVAVCPVTAAYALTPDGHVLAFASDAA